MDVWLIVMLRSRTVRKLEKLFFFLKVRCHFHCTAAAASHALLCQSLVETCNQKLAVWLSGDKTHLSAIYV